MPDEWGDIWATAKARADQGLAAVRDQEEAVRAFMRACIAFDQSLRDAGMEDKQRISCVTNLALGAAIT